MTTTAWFWVGFLAGSVALAVPTLYLHVKIVKALEERIDGLEELLWKPPRL